MANFPTGYTLEKMTGLGTIVKIANANHCKTGTLEIETFSTVTATTVADVGATSITITPAAALDHTILVASPVWLDIVTPGGVERTVKLTADWEPGDTALTVEALRYPIPIGSTVSWPPQIKGAIDVNVNLNLDTDSQAPLDDRGWQTVVPTSRGGEFGINFYYNPTSAPVEIIQDANFKSWYVYIEVIFPKPGCPDDTAYERGEKYRAICVAPVIPIEASVNPVMANLTFTATGPVQRFPAD